jgi:hypothetical protein
VICCATLPLAEVKATAKALGITVNDMVLAIATGGLRTLLLNYGGEAEGPGRVSVARPSRRAEQADECGGIQRDRTA